LLQRTLGGSISSQKDDSSRIKEKRSRALTRTTAGSILISPNNLVHQQADRRKIGVAV